MTYRQFTAQELFCMAEFFHKKALYGIPNGFEMLSEEQAAQVKAEVLDNLLSKQITKMDMDGNTVLADKAYQELITSICDCDACLTVNYQFGVDRSEDVVFWRTATGYLRADAIGDQFVFISEDASGISSYFATLAMKSRTAYTRKTATIPQIALARAKRALADGNKDDAVRVLLQNGADALSDTILAGLQGEADYLGLLLMENKPSEKGPQQAVFLGKDGVLLSLSDAIFNYRNCTTFSAWDENDASAKKLTFLDQFLFTAKGAEE